MLACEHAIYSCGLENPHEYCEVIEILDEFRDERFYLMRYIDENLGNK